MPSPPSANARAARHPYFDVVRPVVIGHRGSAGTHPENTLASFQAALADGAQILESDVHVTRDGVPVLLHDPGVDRVTEAEGLAADQTWAELGRLDAGYRFQETDGSTPWRGRGHRIPSLEEAFARFPEARFNLEIKCHDVAAIGATLDLVARFDRADRTLLTAGEDPIMRDLRTALAARDLRPAIGASLGEIVAAVGSALGQGEMPADVMALQIPAEFAGQPLATPALVDHAHAHGVEVHVWTVNDLGEIEALLDVGVDGIVTDHPGRMAEWLARSGRRKP
jgi:glycerophosphoryl diester phosphodiesterase